MPFLIYKALAAPTRQFVEFWSNRYQYDDEHLYDNNIGRELTEQRLTELFRWKNGMPFAGKKQVAVRRFVERLDELKHSQRNQDAGDLLKQFADGGAIWTIFFLHCWQPLRFPIYDQHVHRGMGFIQTGAIEEIPSYDARKRNLYIQRYLPFHATFDGIDSRSLDKALWAFGKFLAENPKFPTALAVS